jgi:hypothetical protein
MKRLALLLCYINLFAGTASACLLSDLIITQSDCNKEKKFYLTFDFKHKDNSDCFTISGNGKNYGTFPYSKLPLTLGPFSGDCSTNYEFVIRDCKNDACKLVEQYGVVCCENPPCELSDLRLEKTKCDANATFCVSLNFTHSGNSSCFKVSGNGKEYGKYSYSQLPIKICGLAGNCETDYEFVVKDCENSECSVSKNLGIVCCEKPCKLYDLSLVKTDCNDAGQFYVTLNFKYNDTAACFNVKGNGKNYGNFKFYQLPVKLGPFTGDCKTNYEFTVSVCEKAECSVSKSLGIVCCEKKKCEIKELKITKSDCNSDNNFFVTINFKYSGTSSCFKVKGNGFNYGTFNYNQLPIQIGPLKGDCKKQYEFIVYDCEMESCKASKNIGKVCCEFKKNDGNDLKQDEGPKVMFNEDVWKPDYQIEDEISGLQQTSEKLIIRFNNTLFPQTEVQLLNLYGIPVKNKELSRFENVIELNTSDLLPGIYIVLVKDMDKQQLIKFMKW